MAWWLHERVLHASKTCSQSKFTTFQWSRPSYASQTCSLHSKYGRWMKHLIVPCWNIINTNSADANFHALNPPIHCVGPRIACFFIVACKWNQHRKVRLLVSSKTRVYTLLSVSFCSNTKNSIRACFRKIRIQYYTSDNSCCIINYGWICDPLRIEDLIEKGILLGCCGFCLSSRESHTFEQFPAEFAAVNSDDEILK